MDPITLILGALTAGAVAATQETASQIIKDAYAGLKTLIKRRFAEKKAPKGEIALTKYDEEPAVWEAPPERSTGGNGDPQGRGGPQLLSNIDSFGSCVQPIIRHDLLQAMSKKDRYTERISGLSLPL